MTDNNMNDFGNYLKFLRENQGYTLNQLADIIGFSDAYISQIEKNRRRNKPTIDLLKQLSIALDTPFSQLLKRAGYEELAEGQRYKELYTDINLDSNHPDKSIKGNTDEFNKTTELMNLYYNAILLWSNDQRFSKEQTMIIRKHFQQILLKYKQTIENFADLNDEWISFKNYYIGLKGDKYNESDTRKIFLKVKLDSDIKDIVNWIEELPDWIVQQEYNSENPLKQDK